MRLPPRVVIATSNPDKRWEWRIRLEALGVEPVIAEVDYPPEDAPDYEGNAAIKALAAARATGLPAIADDVGLEVDALRGRPGLETRRWAEALGGWAAARDALAGVAGSRATYRCGVALAWPDGRVTTALGAEPGTVVAARGEGPGLESCFVPDGETRTLGELRWEELPASYHRSVALRTLAGEP